MNVLEIITSVGTVLLAVSVLLISLALYRHLKSHEKGGSKVKYHGSLEAIVSQKPTGGYCATIPALDLVAHGETENEASKNIITALSALVEKCGPEAISKRVAEYEGQQDKV
jgi:predicted RNase H-like HicB family nuclease